MSVRARILAAILLTAAIGMAAAGGTVWIVQRERALSAVDNRLESVVADARFVVAEAAASAGATGATTLDAVLETLTQQLRPGTDESTVAVIDGRAVLVPGGDIAFRLDGTPALVDRFGADLAGGEVVRGTSVDGARDGDDGGALRYVAIPVRVEGDAREGGFVLAVNLDARLAPITEASRTFAIVAALALAAIAIVGWLVAGRLLAPVRSLRDAASRIAASGVSERIAVTGRDDVSRLTTTVNDMLDRLDDALAGQQRLLDDVGHELKTPLTIVRGHLELMNADDPADVVATRTLAIDELDRMGGLVRDITAIAEVGRPLSLTPRAVDLATFTAILQTKAAALSPDDWVLVAAAEGTAVFDPDRITQAVLQLAVNAATHAGVPASASDHERARFEIGSELVTTGARPDLRPGDAAPSRESAGQLRDGQLQAGQLRDGQRVRFWVRDFGVGMDSDTQDRIFERFQRGSSGRGVRGSGLGLSIVAAIASIHDGEVRVTSRQGAGSTFIIDLPFRSPEHSPGAGLPRESGRVAGVRDRKETSA